MKYRALAMALLVVACGNSPPPEHAIATATNDAGISGGSVIVDAGDEVDARVEPKDAPPIDFAAPSGFVEESRRDVRVEGEAAIDISYPKDSCVRVAFSAGDAIRASLGDEHVTALHAALGARGAICERADNHLRLVFTGNANVRYVVYRSK